MHLNLFLQLFGVWRAVAESRGNEQVDYLTSGDFGVDIVDSPKYSECQSRCFG